MGEVVLNRQGEVASDGAGGGVDWVGGAHHGSNRLDGVVALNRDRDDRAAGQIVHHAGEERSLFVLGVVLLDGGARGIDQLETGDFKVSCLDPSSDLSDEIALDPAGLDKNKCSFHI